MPRLKCFHKVSIGGLETAFNTATTEDTSIDEQRKVGIKLLSDYHEKLSNQLNALKAKLGKEQDAYTSPSTLSKIAEVEAAHAQPKETSAPVEIPVTPVSIAQPDFDNRISKSNADPAKMKQTLKDTLVKDAIEHPEKVYKLMITNPAKSVYPDNNGFTNGQYAEMLDELKREMKDEFPTNLTFHPLFEQAMFNSTGRQMEMLLSNYNPENRSLFALDQKSMIEYSIRTEVAVVDSADKTIGTFHKVFSSQLQLEAIDTLVGFMLQDFKTNKSTSVDILINTALTNAQAKLQEARTQGNAENEKKWGALVGSFAFNSKDPRLSFTKLIISRFKYLGYSIPSAVEAKLLDKYSVLKSEMTRVASLDIPVEETATYNLSEQVANLDNMAYDDYLTGELKNAKGVYDWSTEAFSVDPRDTASVRLKMWLSGQHQMRRLENGNLEEVKNSFGVLINIDYNTLFGTILGHVASVSSLTPAKIVEILTSTNNPDLIQTGLNLKEASVRIQNEFCRVVSCQYAQWLVVKAVEGPKGSGLDSRLIQAQRASQKQVIIDTWKSAFNISPMAKRKSNGERVMDIERARIHYGFIQAYRLLEDWKDTDKMHGGELEATKAYNSKIEDRFQALKKETGFGAIYSGTLEQLHEDSLGQKAEPQEGDKFLRRDFKTKRHLIGKILKNIFAEYNIILSTDTVTDMGKSYMGRDYMNTATRGTSMEGSFMNQFRFSADGKPRGIFSAFFGKASGAFAGQDLKSAVTDSDEDVVMANNPLYGESPTMNILAQLEAAHSNSIYSVMHKNAEGKGIFDFSMNTSLSSRMQELIEDYPAFSAELEKNILISKDLYGSFYARHWRNNPTQMPSLKYLDALNFNEAKKGTTRVNMSGREQYLTAILLYQNKGRKLTNLMSLTHSDKTVPPIFAGMPRLDVGDVSNRGITESVQKELAQIFEAEHRRIAQHQAVLSIHGTTKNAYFDAGGSHFFFFQDFNKDRLAKLSPELFALLYEPSGDIKKPSQALRDQMRPYVYSIISKHMQNLIEGVKEKWSSNKLTVEHLDGTYITQLSNALEGTPNEGNSSMVLDHAIKDYTINSWLWNVNSALLFYGDPAECWNPKKHKTVNQALAEYAKRLAKDVAPGYDLTWSPTNKNYRSVVLADINTTFKVGDETINANGTDAQEIMTTQEALDNLLASGILDDGIHKEMSNIIEASWALEKSNKDRGNYKFSPALMKRFKDDCKKQFQPGKPVYAGRRKADQFGFAFHDYVKSSVYALLPEYTLGQPMDKLRRWMEENNIQRASFASGKKIGQPTAPVFFDHTGVVPLPTDIDNHIQVLDRKNLRIQQEVPYDEEKDHGKIVSQANKLIVEGIHDITDFSFEGKQVNGTQMRAIKEQIRSQMYRNNLKTLMEDLGAKQNSDGTWSQADKTKLISRLVAVAKSKDYPPNEIALLEKKDENGNYDFPPFLHPAIETFASLLMSEVNKVADFKISGKGLVQSSSSGYGKFIEDSEVDKSTLVYVGDYDGSPLKYVRVENGVVKPAQIYAPFNFFYEENGKQVKARIESFLIKKDDPRYVEGRKQLDHDRVPIELLQMIGMRIPNQNADIPMEIVAFMPDSMNDNVAVPPAITWHMGSDFDVDKLITYKRPYKYDGSKFSVDEGEKDSDINLESRYVNLFWSIVTNPTVFNRRFKALDKPDLKVAAERYALEKDTESFWSPSTQLEMFMSGKDAKILVALSSNATTFTAVMQDKEDLKLGNYAIRKGKPTPVPEPIRLNNLDFVNLGGYGSYKGYSKYDNQTIYQSGAVDNMNQRYLDHLNITVATYPAIQAIHALETTEGKILPVAFSTAMMVQEILWEYSNEMRLGNDSMSGEPDPKLAATVYEKLKTKWEAKLETLQKALQKNPDADIEITIDSLNNMWDIKNKKKGSTETLNYVNGQLQVLHAFKRLSDIGSRLARLQGTLSQDTKGAGKSILHAMKTAEAYNQMAAQMEGTGILGEASLIQGTEQSVAYHATVPIALKLGETIFPMKAIQNFTAQVALLQDVDPTDVSVATREIMVRGLRSATLSSSPTITMNSGFNELDNKKERARLQLGSDTLAVRVENYKQNHLSNRFINRIRTNINPEGNGPDRITFNNTDLRNEQDLVVSDLRKLLLSEDKSEVMLAEDLIKYTLLLTPQKGPTSFVTQIPSDALLSTDFTQDLKNMVARLRAEDGIFNRAMQQVIQHNPRAFATEIKADFLNKNLSSNVYDDRDYPEVITVLKKEAESIMVARETGSFVTTPSPYLCYYSKDEKKPILYMHHLGDAVGEYVQYQRIDTLGEGAESEYDLHDESKVLRSIYKQNQAGLEFKTPPALTQIRNSMNGMIDDSTTHGDFYASWGLVDSSDSRVLDQVMERVAADRGVPLYLRTLANFVKPVHTPNFSLVVAPLTDGTMGQFNLAEETMTVTPGRTKAIAATILIHEIGHKNSELILHSLGYSDEVEARKNYEGDDFDAIWANYTEEAKRFRESHPELYQKTSEIDRLRYQAWTVLQTKIASGEIEKGSKLEQTLSYGLQNIHEFVSTVLEDKTIMRFLNDIDSTETKTWVQNLVDKILDFFVAVGEYMGVKVRDRSILKQAYAMSYQLVTETYGIVSAGDDDVLYPPQTIKTPNENEADLIQSNIETLYGQEVKKSDDGLNFNLTVTRNKKSFNFESDSPNVQAVLSKFNKQLIVLDGVLSRPVRTEKDKENRIRARRFYAEILEDATNLKNTKDLKSLAETGAKQLQWASSIMKSKYPHISEVEMATELVSVWTDMNKLHGSQLEDLDEDFGKVAAELAGNAQQMWQMVYRFQREPYIQAGIAAKDMSDNLVEQGVARQWGLGMTRDTNPFMQYNAKLTQAAKDNVTEARAQRHLKLKGLKSTLEKWGKDNGLKIEDVYKKFIQETETGNSFGLVQELDANWFKQSGGTYGTLLSSLEDFRKQTPTTDPKKLANRAVVKRELWKNYWDSMLSKGELINPQIFFDKTTGKRIEGDHPKAKLAQKEYDRLLTHSGNKTLLDSTLEKVQLQIEKYLEDKEQHESIGDDSWEYYNSPFKFVNTRNQAALDERNWNHNGTNKPEFIPGKNSEYYDSKYTEIQKDDVLRGVYDEFVKMSKEYRSYMPPSIANRLHDNFLPIINIADVAAAYSLLKDLSMNSIGNGFLNSISISQFEKDRIYSRETPIKYTSTRLPKDADGNVDLSQVSIDIPKLFEIFGDMATNYRYMAPVKANLDIVKKIVQEESTKRIELGKQGLNRLIENIDYYNRAMTAEKGMNHEGVLTDPVYDWNPVVHKRIKKEVEDLGNQIEVVKKEINTLSSNTSDKAYEDPTRDPLENDFIGVALLEKQKELQALEEELDKKMENVRYITASAGGNTLLSINQMKGMAFNPLSAVSNLAQGMLGIFIHARGFRADKETGTTKGDFTVQQIRWGLKMMRSSVGKSWGSLVNYEGSDEAQKIRAIMDKLGLIDVLLDTHAGYSNLTSEEKSYFKRNFDWAGWQKTGDFITKGAFVLAMMKNKLVTVTEDGVEKQVHLFEALDKEGNWDVAKYGENEAWHSEYDKDTKQQEWSDFRSKVKAASLIVFGSQDPNVPIFMKQWLVGRLLGQYRTSWINEGINTRFGDKYYDARLGRTVEGRWKTYAHLKGWGVPLLIAQLTSVITGKNAFEGVQSEREVENEDGEGTRKVWGDIQEHEIENMRKNIAGLAYTIGVTAALMLLRGTLPSEEEKRRRAKLGLDKSSYTKLCINLLIRTQQDLTFYSNPSTATQLLGTPVPSVSVVTDALAAVHAYSLLLGDDPDKVHKWALKQTKAVPIINNWNKWEFYTGKDISTTQFGK